MSTLSLPSFLGFFFTFNYLNYFLLSSGTLHPLSTCFLIWLLLLIVSKLNGEPVADAAERGGLHLPVVDGVGVQTDAVVERPLHPKPAGAEVVHAHLVDVVGMEVHHLRNGSANAEGERTAPGETLTLRCVSDSPEGISSLGGRREPD